MPIENPSQLQQATEEQYHTITGDAGKGIILVTSFFTARSGMEVIARQELKDFMKRTRVSEGCISSELFYEQTNPASLMLISQWQSEEYFIKHLSSPLVSEYAPKNQQLGETPLNVKRWSQIS